MATLAEIRDLVDVRLAVLWASIQAQEAAYAAAHNGRFWQGRKTHSVTPSEGNESPCDISTGVPTDQPTPWPLAIRNSTQPMALQIDVYDGAMGVGYVATVEVSVIGHTYRRAAQVGPEAWRTYPWQQADPPVGP